MKKIIWITTLILSTFSMSVNADTAKEIRDVVLANMAHTNKNLSQDPMRISSAGSKEFFSSGGLLNTITRKAGVSDFEYFSGTVKHIEVVVLVEGQAAVAHYYQEASMKPKGLPAVPNYRTRVTQLSLKRMVCGASRPLIGLHYEAGLEHLKRL